MIPQLGNPRVMSLSDAESCYVTRDVHGFYEMDLTIPTDLVQKYYYYFFLGQIIKAIPNREKPAEKFIITDIQKELHALCTIHAVHESYNYNSLMLNPWSDSTTVPRDALALIDYNVVQDLSNPKPLFVYDWSEPPTGRLDAPKKPTALRPFLLNNLVQGFGGMIDFAQGNVRWCERIGANRGAVILYGANLVSMKISEVATDYYTGIYPYYGELDNEQKPLVQLPNRILQLQSSESRPVNIMTLDLTNHFENTPTVAQLQAVAEQEAEAIINTPMKQIDFEHIQRKRDANLYLDDDVYINCHPIGVHSITRRITKLVFDVIREKVIKANVGDLIPSLAENIL